MQPSYKLIICGVGSVLALRLAYKAGRVIYLALSYRVNISDQ